MECRCVAKPPVACPRAESTAPVVRSKAKRVVCIFTGFLHLVDPRSTTGRKRYLANRDGRLMSSQDRILSVKNVTAGSVSAKSGGT